MDGLFRRSALLRVAHGRGPVDTSSRRLISPPPPMQLQVANGSCGRDERGEGESPLSVRGAGIEAIICNCSIS